MGLVPLKDSQFSGFYTKAISASDEVIISAGLEHKKIKNTIIQLSLICPSEWDETKATKTLEPILESINLVGER